MDTIVESETHHIGAENRKFQRGDWHWVTLQGHRQPAKLYLIWSSTEGDTQYYFALAGQIAGVPVEAQFIGPRVIE